MERLLPAMTARAGALDAAGAFPAADFEALRAAGVLAWPLPVALGGRGAGTTSEGAGLLLKLLRRLGRGNLSVARLFEAHVNALRLIVRFGDAAAQRRATADVAAGALFGLWVTDAPGGPGVGAAGDVLSGAKGPCSGAGHCRRAVVTATTEGGVRLAVVALAGSERVTPMAGLQGMRAAANGTVELDGVRVRDWLGEPGDYLREPTFPAARGGRRRRRRGRWRRSSRRRGRRFGDGDRRRRRCRWPGSGRC